MAELALLIAVAKDVQSRLESDYEYKPGAPLFMQYPSIKEDMDDFIQDAEGKERMLTSGMDDLATIDLEILDIVVAVVTRGTEGAVDTPGTRERMGKDLPHPINEYRLKALHLKLYEPVKGVIKAVYGR